MKNSLTSLITAIALCPAAMATTTVTLNFATDLTGILPGGDAGSVTHDPTDGGRVLYTATSGWKPNCVIIDFTATQQLQDAYAQMVLNGGKITFTTTIDTTGLAVDPPPDPPPAKWGDPGWFENMVSSTPGENAIGGAWSLLSLYGGTFPLAAPRSQVTTIVIEPSATFDNSDKVLQIAPEGTSTIRIGMNSESNTYNSATLILDDLIIEANDTSPAIVLPTLGVEIAKPGLNVISSTSGQWDRQCLRTANPQYSWVGATSYPVTYSIDIAEFPPLPGHGALMYFVPGSAVPTSMNYPDWGQPICALAWIVSNTTGGGDIRFAYKDDPVNGGGNGSNGVAGHEYWVNDDGTGQGGSVAYAQSDRMAGKWSVIFNSATEVTVETPQGTTASGQILQSTADKFAGDMYVYFGTVNNQIANIGQNVIFNEVAITGGVAAPFTEGFDVFPYDEARLEKSGTNPASILQVTRADTPFFVFWSLPASGFGLQHSPTLKTSEWVDLPTADAFSVNGVTRYKLLYSTEVPTAADHFRLVKP
jgi:hypothetical protein